MNFQERLRIGLTRPAVFRAARRCAEDGRCSRSDYQKHVAETVACEWLTTECSLESDDENLLLNWDEIIAFIERLLPLILRIIEIFSAT